MSTDLHAALGYFLRVESFYPADHKPFCRRCETSYDSRYCPNCGAANTMPGEMMPAWELFERLGIDEGDFHDTEFSKYLVIMDNSAGVGLLESDEGVYPYAQPDKSPEKWAGLIAKLDEHKIKHGALEHGLVLYWS